MQSWRAAPSLKPQAKSFVIRHEHQENQMGASDFAKLPHIGEAVRRKEDYRFLTGSGQYTDDINLQNQRYAVFVRSPHAHAAIKSVDVSKAEAQPGVARVFTGKD